LDRRKLNYEFFKDCIFVADHDETASCSMHSPKPENSTVLVCSFSFRCFRRTLFCFFFFLMTTRREFDLDVSFLVGVRVGIVIIVIELRDHAMTSSGSTVAFAARFSCLIFFGEDDSAGSNPHCRRNSTRSMLFSNGDSNALAVCFSRFVNCRRCLGVSWFMC